MRSKFEDKLKRKMREKKSSHLVAVRIPDKVMNAIKGVKKRTKVKNTSKVIVEALRTQLKVETE